MLGRNRGATEHRQWSAENLTAGDIKDLLLAKDDMRQTAFHYAAQHGGTEVLQKLWQWSAEKLSAEEIKGLLLAKNDMRHTAFHYAARFGEHRCYRT